MELKNSSNRTIYPFYNNLATNRHEYPRIIETVSCHVFLPYTTDY